MGRIRDTYYISVGAGERLAGDPAEHLCSGFAALIKETAVA